MAFGLLTTGFNRKRLSDVRASLVEGWRGAFGDNADTDPDTPDGHMIDILATELALLWEAAEDSHTSQFLASASGVSLDLVLEILGLKRIPASPSTLDSVFVYGTAAVVVVGGSVASTEDQGDRFLVGVDASDPPVSADTTIGASTDAYVVEVVEATAGEDYTVEIDGTPETHTAVGGETVQDIRDELVDEINAGPNGPAIAAGDRPGGGAILVLTGAAGLVVTSTADTPANIDQFDAEPVANTTAEDTGPRAAAAGTLNTIETPITGWEGVANTLDAELGRDIESDEAARVRARDLLRAVGSATPDAIAARLREVTVENGFTDSVESAIVFENTTDLVDGDGRPPHSFEAVTLGGLASEVAQQIWDHKPAGIATFGSTSTGVVDINGDPHTVDHSFATELYTHLLVTITKGEGFTAPAGEAALAAQVEIDLAAWGDANLGLGDDLYRASLNTPIIASLGGSPTAASSIVTTTGTTPLPGDPTPPLSAADIVAAPGEIVRLDSARIEVVFV